MWWTVVAIVVPARYGEQGATPLERPGVLIANLLAISYGKAGRRARAAFLFT